MYLLTAAQHAPYCRLMSLISAIANAPNAPVSAGCLPLRTGSVITTIITTGTGTTGNGWAFVRK